MNTTNPSPVRALLADLNNRFPVFRDAKPLSIGINKQLAILLEGTEAKVLRTALRNHTQSIRYLKAMEKAECRYDLDGNASGEVTEEQRQHAAELLRERFKKQAEVKRQADEARKAEERHQTKLKQLTEKFGRKNG
jgi:ProP effector